MKKAITAIGRSIEEHIFGWSDLSLTITEQARQIAGLRKRLERAERDIARARWRAAYDLVHADGLLCEALELLDFATARRVAERAKFPPSVVTVYEEDGR